MGKKYYSGNAGYPTEFRGFKSLRRQAEVFEAEVVAEDDEGERIGRYLDGSRLEKLASGIQIPPGWDGIAVVPKPHKLAPLYRGRLKGFEYNQAYAHILQILVHRCGLRSDPGLAFGTDLDGRMNKLYQKLLAQPGDYFVFAAQLGRAYPDHRVQTAVDGLGFNEVPLDPYLAACLVLAHPERLADMEASPVCCAGAKLRDDPGRVPLLRRAGVQHGDGTVSDLCLQVKHAPSTEPGWLATARIPGY